MGCCTHTASVWDIKFNYANASESGGLVPAPSAGTGSVQGWPGLGSCSGRLGERVWVGQPSLGEGSLQPAVLMSSGTDILG